MASFILFALAGMSFVAANVSGLIAAVLAFTKHSGERYAFIWSAMAFVMGLVAGMTFARMFLLAEGWVTWLPATILGAFGLLRWLLANRRASPTSHRKE